jgi:hypothetical protein
LTLDAFARCWVQERTLLDAVVTLLEEEQRAPMERLIAAWNVRNLERFHRSMAVLADQLAETARDREEVGNAKWHDRVKGAVLNPSGGDRSPAGERAMGKLAERLDMRIRKSTDELIALHGLSGRAAQEVLRRLADDYTESAPARPGIAAVLGGLVSGAAGGLAADVAAGGLTLGGGMIVGGILGAVGAGSAAKTYNMARGEETNAVRWSQDFYCGLVRSALLRYLAVAHFGRGRGEWEEGEHPVTWQAAVANEAAKEQRVITSIWNKARDAPPAETRKQLELVLERIAQRLLRSLYPQTAVVFGEASGEGNTIQRDLTLRAT